MVALDEKRTRKGKDKQRSKLTLKDSGFKLRPTGREKEWAHGNQTDERQVEKKRQNERQSERDKCVQLLSAPL